MPAIYWFQSVIHNNSKKTSTSLKKSLASKVKNVLLIASDLGKGGAERSISLLSCYLQEYYQVTLCILSGKDREQFYKTCDDMVFIVPPDFQNTAGKIKSW